MRRAQWAPLALCLGLVVRAALGAEKVDLVPPLPEAVGQLLQDRKYPEALAAIDALKPDEKTSAAALAYLRARVQFLAGQFDEAAAAFEQLEKAQADGPWAARARFGRAVALAKKGDFAAAEEIYHREAERLLSAERKAELADIYLEYADKYFAPKERDAKPEYQKALDFYLKALELGHNAERKTQVELLVAECYQYLGNFGEAAGRFERFVKERAASPLVIEARFRLGECQLAQGQAVEARRTWQDLLAKHEGAQHERLAEAAFNLARTWQLPQPASDEDLTLGVAALDSFVEKFVDHKLAGAAHVQIAQSYLHRGRPADAAAALARFLKNPRYAERPEVPVARQLLGQAYQQQKRFADALATWREYLAAHPAHELWSGVQQAVIDTEYLMAEEAKSQQKYDDARKLWNEFLAKYPLEPRAARTFVELGQIDYEEKKFEEAIAAWRRVVSKYPGSADASRAQYLVASTLEEKLGRLEEALDEYKKLNWGDHAGPAAQRAAVLTADGLAVQTERVFRSSETPRIKLLTRNIESLSIRAYSVDLETYFRKMHLGRGVESLDIALIDPDQTIDYTVSDYAKYQQLERFVELPLAGGAKTGVLAVTVSGKTLEATTLVVQSDLEIVVKSSRDEAFVFAENLLTGKPWPGARLLLSNGAQVFAEAKTGDDGVFRQAYQELKDPADLRIFAVADGSVASNVVGLKGIGVAKGLVDRGYIFTDRAAYRAGQMVHVRGIIRRADGDAFVVDEGAKFTLDVLDSRNRTVRQQAVALDRFGALAAHFVLPPASPQGQYRLVVRNDDGKSYQGSFVVHEYQLEPVRLSVDTPRKVYYRGEEIAGTIKAAYYYGAPLAGREIRYQLAGDRVVTATTDDKGEVPFKLATREFRESQVLPLVVTLPERNLQLQSNLFLSTTGFAISASTVRPVYLAGESFELSASVRDAEGKPLPEKLLLGVYELTVVAGKVGERLVAEHKLEADKDGNARQTLVLEKGGQYVLRLSGTDRYKNTITGQHAVQISDENDAVRLRILAEKHTFKVGDLAKVKLHWREAPALALVTLQGARVIDYKLVELATGENELPIPIDAKLAPNFDLSIAVMTDTRPAADAPTKPIVRFHTADSPFAVERELKVELVARRPGGEKGAPRPGEAVEVVVRTTDPQGKPAAAQVSLAMVEQALFERFGAGVPAIGEFFRGARRQSAMRTVSSVTFRYEPATQPINPRLLAEKDRKELAAAERGVEGDFDSLLGLIVNEVKPDAWDESGSGTISPFATNLSVVVEQTGRETDGAELADEALDVNGEPATAAAGATVAAGDDSALGLQRGLRADAEIRYGAATGRASRARAAFGRDSGYSIAKPKSEKSKLAAGKAGVFPVADLVLPKRAAGLESESAEHWHFGRPELQVPSLGTRFAAPTSGEFARLKESGQSRVQVMFANGMVENFALAANREDNVKLAKKLSEAGAVLVETPLESETAYWNPAVTTDEKGEATLTFTLPERATAWKLLAKGITVDTLAGEAEVELAVNKELFGELKLPLAFVAGDKAQIVATVHNDLVEKGQLDVVLRTTIGGRTVEERKPLDFKAKGIGEVVFTVSLDQPAANAEPEEKIPAADAADQVSFELVVTAGQQRDVLRRTLPLLPYGMSVFATAGGKADSDTTVWVEPPAAMPLARPSLEIIVGASVEQSLLDVVLSAAPACQLDALRLASGLESATSDLLASLALVKLHSTGAQVKSPHLAALDGRIRSAVGQLVAAQRDDGGWGWTDRAAASNRYTSARAAWALAKAKSAGYAAGDALEKALAYLQAQVAATADSDYESKAILLHALAAAGRGDFALANRLHRERLSLSAGGLVHLALAFAEMDRQSLAGEVLAGVTEKKLDEGQPRRLAAGSSIPWSGSPAELRALYALALVQISPADAKTKAAIDWLLAHRVGHRWAPDKATGPATIALCDWFAKNRFQSERYDLTVFVNDLKVTTLPIDASTPTQTVSVPARMLKGGKERVNFQIAGRGQYTFQCVLGGFVGAEKLASTTKDWHVERTYEPAPLERDGQEIPRGFGLLEGSYQQFRNPLTQLPVGRRGHVELVVWRANVPANTPEEHLEYLVVTEPLPAGVAPVEQSIKGGFERYEILPGAITFYVGSRAHVEPIHFDVHGYAAGEYRAAPTLVRNAYRPEQIAIAPPKPLAVLAAGQKSADEYRLTPLELYELGKRLFESGDLAAAGPHLDELFANWRLQPDYYKQTARMLLDIHLAGGNAALVAKYFEIIKEKWPDLEVPFEKIVKVGAAYHELGEYERSYLVFRATVESSFQRESGVAGFLDAQGEFMRSIDVMRRLLAEYPPEPYVAAANYALAQRVYAKAPEAAADPQLKAAKINRATLVKLALEMLDRFLSTYPDDPAADQAAFSLANALLELKAHKQAIASSGKFTERYPKSDYLDSYWFVIGYSHFALGEHDAALEMCRKVAEAKRLDRASGREVDSPNKWPAIYILGQVYHSLGKAAEAIREYARVESRFADAKAAIEYFTRKAISLPEVTTIAPGKPAAVDLSFRNVAAADVMVYRIDLMKFSLLQRNLGGITRINLAGIKPYHEARLELGNGQDYRDRQQSLELPLKEEGAYLVVCRGDNLHASGLVLLTPLAVEVQEQADSGRVRTTVKDVTADQYLADVHVKVIGSNNPDFTAGQTDLRGVFVADGIQGTSTVIALAEGGKYAFFRGQTQLGPPPAPAQQPAAPAEGKAPAKGQQEDLLEQLQRDNFDMNQRGGQQLKQLYEQQNKGVKAQSAF